MSILNKTLSIAVATYTIILWNQLCLAADGPVSDKQKMRDWANYRNLARIFDKFQSIPLERRSNLRFDLRATASPVPIYLKDVILVIRGKNGDIPVRFDEAGDLLLPLNSMLLSEDPQIWTPLPLGEKLTLRPQLIVIGLSGRKFSSGQLSEWVDESNRCIRDFAGSFALFAPKVHSIMFRFNPDHVTTIEQLGPNGKTVLRADAKGVIVINPAELPNKDSTTFLLSTDPIEITPDVPPSAEYTARSDQ